MDDENNPPIHQFEEDFVQAEKMAEIKNQDVIDFIFGKTDINNQKNNG